jgi:non-heme chloroperoxidase
MRRVIKGVVIAVVLFAVVAAGIVAGLLVFGTAKAPKPLGSITKPFAAMDYGGLPPVEHYTARDGASLSFRTYTAGDKEVVVLIHGSAGSSADMRGMAKAIQAAGITAYVPDLRGHGDNHPHGDINYLGQLDDDMADFIRVIQPAHQGAKWDLVGFSSGGGFALRLAAEPVGQSFDRYVLLSPFLMYDAPTARTAHAEPAGQTSGDQAVWTTVSVGRIIGLQALNAVGVHFFDGLAVIHFAVPPDVPSVTDAYSWRLLLNFQPHEDFMADIRAVSKPMQVLVGGKDELFLPEKFEPVFDANRKDIPVTIVSDFGHIDMITNPAAIDAVVKVLRE